MYIVYMFKVEKEEMTNKTFRLPLHKIKAFLLTVWCDSAANMHLTTSKKKITTNKLYNLTISRLVSKIFI